jgi:proline iminopeptidase
MKVKLILSIWLLMAISIHAQSLYIKTFGAPKDKAMIFLHGGPGYNAANFEATTAQQLADQGFFVIVYDRRGEGRSLDKSAQFTFQQSFQDLNSIYQQYQIKKAILIGHSFGGLLATLYAEQYPKAIESLVLVGAPIDLQTTFKTIIKHSKNIYDEKKDSVNLKYIQFLERMDVSTMTYASYCFMHAMQNKFYSPQQLSEGAKQNYALFKTDTLLKKYAGHMTYEAPQGFWKNEQYTTRNISSNLKHVIAKKIKVFGLYGKDDGLYGSEQIMAIQSIIGQDKLVYLEDCSHSVFLDQPTLFLNTLKQWSKE